jgi:hypothetical protein
MMILMNLVWLNDKILMCENMGQALIGKGCEDIDIMYNAAHTYFIMTIGVGISGMMLVVSVLSRSTA